MKKVAIVGVEGSGKTVMLAGLGELYSKPDEQGYFLSPKNFSTASYVVDKIARMRQGEWPTATAGDEMQGLDWTLKKRCSGRKPSSVCEVSFLDFAGEVYRAAFGVRKDNGDAGLANEVAELKSYIREADAIIVLINLRDVIVHGLAKSNVQEAMWITNEILAFALDGSNGKNPHRAAIVLSQADSYRETIADSGGASNALKRYLPHVWNNYDWLDIFSASAVDKTELDGGGNVVPAPDFGSECLKPIMDWILKDSVAVPLESADMRRVEPPVRRKGRTNDPGDLDYELGLRYEAGDGVPKNLMLALKYYRKAAALGHAESKYRIGWMYEHGICVTQDNRLAMEWYADAASRGCREAKVARKRVEGEVYEYVGFLHDLVTNKKAMIAVLAGLSIVAAVGVLLFVWKG